MSPTTFDKILEIVNEQNPRDSFASVSSNPPYNSSSNGINSDIWQNFIEIASFVSERGNFIHPGRWVIPKKSMVPIQNALVATGLSSFNYLVTSPFPGVAIDGNTSITEFDFRKMSKEIQYSIDGESKGVWSRKELLFVNKLEEELYGHFKGLLTERSMDDIRVGILGSLGVPDFGYQKSRQISKLSKSCETMQNPIKIWANSEFGRGGRFEWFWIDEKDIEKTPDFLKATSSSKVMIDKKGNAPSHIRKKGNFFNNSAEIVGKNVIASGKVFLIPVNDTPEELKLIASLMTTKTARCLMSITQKDLYARGLDNIPLYADLSESLYQDGGTHFTDEWFYSHYRFSAELIDYIENTVTDKNDVF